MSIQTFVKVSSVAVAVSLVLSTPCSAQGLKSSSDVSMHSGRSLPPLVSGKSDSERWSNVASIGPRLIGLKREEVEAKLGPGLHDSARRQLQYALGPGRASGPGYDYTCLLIKFNSRGVVCGYSITSMDWN